MALQITINMVRLNLIEWFWSMLEWVCNKYSIQQVYVPYKIRACCYKTSLVMLHGFYQLHWTYPFYPLEWLASNFSKHYTPWIKCKGYKNKRNDQQFKFLIVKQIALIIAIGNVKGIVWRMWILILGCNLNV